MAALSDVVQTARDAGIAVVADSHDRLFARIGDSPFQSFLAAEVSDWVLAAHAAKQADALPRHVLRQAVALLKGQAFAAPRVPTPDNCMGQLIKRNAVLLARFARDEGAHVVADECGNLLVQYDGGPFEPFQLGPVGAWIRTRFHDKFQLPLSAVRVREALEHLRVEALAAPRQPPRYGAVLDLISRDPVALTLLNFANQIREFRGTTGQLYDVLIDSHPRKWCGSLCKRFPVGPHTFGRHLHKVAPLLKLAGVGVEWVHKEWGNYLKVVQIEGEFTPVESHTMPGGAFTMRGKTREDTVMARVAGQVIYRYAVRTGFPDAGYEIQIQSIEDELGKTVAPDLPFDQIDRFREQDYRRSKERAQAAPPPSLSPAPAQCPDAPVP